MSHTGQEQLAAYSSLIQCTPYVVAMTESVPPGGAVLDADELDARWEGAWRPEQVAGRLAGVSAPWCIAAGWALDLFRGRQSRPHSDLEIAVPSDGFMEIRDRFPEYVV